ncbi:MAG: hypothetical protein A2312_02115 [Candidatus Staskawiczbacteria bacterium RIFOXYB2_FULL_32_9]|uniref:Uncharacterized protein n=1 Tax=Candidatus Staskawiczbacteria bacterium RIFOXYD1_FULL_32_13 TaxID=1802234 RepID=A0A1G2JNY8_9BACT|nr:MAG: hypothetical protein UR22_C0018G0021 [Parcubacteria group bacterium GW2011_GWC2_32_10]OGZ80562.1 MAG: hypothetical protein A2256_04340 [Candidatus Staskawiczbacteria bacterium RIFOXYA2_FULL_32_7]OGZ81000.1 MAG: hypothetical protein A2360_02275 [Candidatus Staskawiczbacteria bacterium RIFOXYB1_FULL_32_11]OGZ81274.1 MAG: hypothetical protein A2312_02115 [Candidatus Staskawiczbacteria bacterium RIFOXYB2_FULL_32_9]OGZ88855.1 MAG: hypothetical protein A2561_01680 [Candidatus Staskawiczbacter
MNNYSVGVENEGIVETRARSENDARANVQYWFRKWKRKEVTILWVELEGTEPDGFGSFLP